MTFKRHNIQRIEQLELTSNKIALYPKINCIIRNLLK